MLLQVLNPFCSKRIKIFHNPDSGKYTFVEKGLVNGIEDQANSDYVKKDQDIAFKLTRKTYFQEAFYLFEDCDAFMNSGDDPFNWNEFALDVMEYSKYCDK